MNNFDRTALIRAAGIGAAAAALLGLLSGIPLCGLICCVVPLLYLGVGAVYPFFAGRATGLILPMTSANAAMGGALAAGIAGIVYSVVGAISAAIFVTPETAATLAAQLEQLGVPADTAATFVAATPTVGTVLLGMCIGLLLGAVFGGIGAAVYASTRRPSTPAIPRV